MPKQIIPRSLYGEILKRYFAGEPIVVMAKDLGVKRATLDSIIHFERTKLNLNKRPPLKYIDKKIIGQKFGDLEIINLEKTEGKAWRAICKCYLCGREDYSVLPRVLRVKTVLNCGCKDWVRKRGGESSIFKGYEEISLHFYNQILKGAKVRRISFDIDIEFMWNLFVAQNRKCALSGRTLTLDVLNYGKRTASLDRKDSLLGYTKENVRWVHKDLNKMKLHYSNDYFLQLCKEVTDYNFLNEKSIPKIV